MRRAYIASFPKFSAHEKWLFSFRDKHDPKARFIAPHITLVFPTSQPESHLLAEAQRISAGFHGFHAEFKTAMLMPEADGSSSIFLVPDKGLSDLVRLHDGLYSGVLSSELRLDLPFIPHITIGASLGRQTAKRLVDELNAKTFSFSVKIHHLEIVRIESEEAPRYSVARLSLGK